jgi:hypothetical protein
MSLTSNVIGPITVVDWVFLRELRSSIQWMLNNQSKFKNPFNYEIALNKEQEVYKKTLKGYLDA